MSFLSLFFDLISKYQQLASTQQTLIDSMAVERATTANSINRGSTDGATLTRWNAPPLHSGPPPPYSTGLPSNHNNNTIPIIVGGDLGHCLTNVELDMLLGAVRGIAAVPAVLLYSLRTCQPGAKAAAIAYTHSVIQRAVHRAEIAVIPVHVRHHWMVAVLRRGDSTLLVFDSAPSPITKKDARKVIDDLGFGARFFSPFRQRRDSFECGLFVLLYAVLARTHLPMLTASRSPCTLDLSGARRFVMERGASWSSDDVDAFMRMTGVSGVPAWRHDPYGSLGRVDVPFVPALPPVDAVAPHGGTDGAYSALIPPASTQLSDILAPQLSSLPPVDGLSTVAQGGADGAHPELPVLSAKPVLVRAAPPRPLPDVHRIRQMRRNDATLFPSIGQVVGERLRRDDDRKARQHLAQVAAVSRAAVDTAAAALGDGVPVDLVDRVRVGKFSASLSPVGPVETRPVVPADAVSAVGATDDGSVSGALMREMRNRRRRAAADRKRIARRLSDSSLLDDAYGKVEAAAESLTGGYATPDTVLDEALRLAQAAAEPQHRLEVVKVADSYRAVKGLIAGDELVDRRRATFIPLFDGPPHDGHYFAAYFFPTARRLHVVDTAPHYVSKEAVAYWVGVLEPSSIHYERVPACGEKGCAGDVVIDFCRATRVAHPPIGPKVLRQWSDHGVPAMFFVTKAEAMPCRWCGTTGQCSCSEPLSLPAARVAPAATLCFAATALMAAAHSCVADFEVLPVAGGGVLPTAPLADVRAKTPAEVREVFRQAAAERGIDSRAGLVGKTVHAILRMKTPGGMVKLDWFGTITRCGGSDRAPDFSVEYFASSDGPIFADDGVHVVLEKGCLPPRNDDHVDVIHVEVLDAPPDGYAPDAESESSSDDGDDDAGATRAKVATKVVTNVSNYPPVADMPLDIDLSLWPAFPALPEGVAPRGCTGADYLQYGILSLEQAQRRCPDLVWAATTQPVRTAHVADLQNLRQFILAKPEVARLPIDVVLAYFLQLRRIDRSWAWSTTQRVAASYVGAFASLPLYALYGPSLALARMPFFKNLLHSAGRLAAAVGAREPVAATSADVKAALSYLDTDKLKVMLLLCWFTSARPCDVLQLKKANVQLKDDGVFAIKVTQGKVVADIEAYHIWSRIADPEADALLRRFIGQAPDGYIFPLKNAYQRQGVLAQLRNALRCVSPALELRSLRRGSLQALAAAGASVDELLCFSRHTTPAALFRYLGWNLIPHQAQRGGIEKAAALAAGLRGGDPKDFAVEVRIRDWLTVSTEGGIELSTERPPPVHAPDVDRSAYKLHAKPATTVPIDLAAVDELAANCSERVRRDWELARKLLSDADGFHSRVPFDGVVHDAALRIGDITKLLDIGNVAVLTPEEEARIAGSIKIFLVPEDDKQRFRVIKWPILYNLFYGHDTVPFISNATRDSARRAIRLAKGALSLDLSAEFDQVPLDYEVTMCQVFRVGTACFRNRRCPMGGRHSSFIGTALLHVLCDFDAGRVIIDTATDAARFAGDEDDVVNAAWTFVQRCRLVGAHLNDIDCATATREQLRDLYRTEEADFYGEVASYDAKTVRCRDKHLRKLAFAFEHAQRKDATFSDLFALYGVLHWMSTTLRLRLDRYLPVRLFFSTLARRLATNPGLWAKPARAGRLPEGLWHWIDEAMANKPASVMDPPAPDTIVIGDACVAGYAGIVVHRTASGVLTVSLRQQRWAASDHGVESSVVAEPEAAVRLIQHAETLFPHAVVAYVTDHLPFAFAFAKGYSSAPVYNQRITRILDAKSQASFLFMPGHAMIADSYSRMEASVLSEDDRRAALALAAEIFCRELRGT